MKIIVAIHGILTGETDPSWVDHFDAWLLERDPQMKVLKKEYRAGPWPRWNCWVRNPRLARGLAAEIELLTTAAALTAPRRKYLSQELPSAEPRSTGASMPWEPADYDPPAIWFVAHSNGAVIALETMQRLIARGYWVAGAILTGAACEGEARKSPVLKWLGRGRLGTAIAYSSKQDEVLAPPKPARPDLLAWMKAAAWRWLLWPYGSLGRTGWTHRGKPLEGPAFLRTRWFACAHSGYFAPEARHQTFETIYQDIVTSPYHGLHAPRRRASSTLHSA